MTLTNLAQFITESPLTDVALILNLINAKSLRDARI